MKERPLVLVADDSSAIRMKLSERFEEEGFSVIEAVDGLDCIKKVFKYNPDFVILDVKMPKFTGYQACRFLKSHPHTAHIPVMILTALDQPLDELWGYQTGADIYRTKNTKIEVLIEDAKRMIKTQGSKLSEWEREITEIEILNFLNEVLDERLFQLTLINDIINLSFKTENLDELLRSSAQYLYKISPFYCVGIVLEEEKNYIVYMYSVYEYGEEFDDMFRFIKNSIAKEEKGFNVNYFSGIEPLPSDYQENREFIFFDSLQNVEEGRGTHGISGGIFISTTKEGAKQLNRISFLLNTILLVLHNGLLYQRVLDLSMIDELTSLYNRRKIIEILNLEIERAKRYGYEMSIIMADIDNFKKINDSYGHQAGDLVLKKVANVLKNSLRKVDYVGRFGGEEFLIICSQTSLKNAMILAERIRSAVETMYFGDKIGKVTISLGVTSSKGEKDIDKIINDADRALYQAKRDGKNCVRNE